MFKLDSVRRPSHPSNSLLIVLAAQEPSALVAVIIALSREYRGKSAFVRGYPFSPLISR